MAARTDYIGIVEAAYRPVASDSEWLAGVLDVAAPMVDRGAGVAAIVYESPSDQAIVVRDFAATPGFTIQPNDSLSYMGSLRGPLLERMFRRTDAMFLRRDAAGHPTGYPTDYRYWSTRGVEEAFAVVGFDLSGHGVMLAAPAPPRARAAGPKRGVLRCVAAHLAAAIRLRKVGRGEPTADLVLERDGAPAAKGRIAAETRRALQSAARRLELARASAPGNADAIGLWTALWSGRWTLVDHYEKSGRRYLLARRNDPELVEPRALSQRERQVLAYARVGHSQKFIAFELGLAPSTVAECLASGMRKLGVRSRLDLATFSVCPEAPK